MPASGAIVFFASAVGQSGAVTRRGRSADVHAIRKATDCRLSSRSLRSPRVNGHDPRRGHMKKRGVCSWLAALLLCTHARVATAQSAPAASSGFFVVGPTLTQTAEWLKEQLPILGLDVVETRAVTGGQRLEVDRLGGVALSKCQLTVKEWLKRDTKEFPPGTYVIPLFDHSCREGGKESTTAGIRDHLRKWQNETRASPAHDRWDERRGIHQVRR